ncbi:MAG: S-layer homology domain-containing protein [Candidatus Peribacteraceae bacterium]|jgi:hypothetical protein
MNLRHSIFTWRYAVLATFLLLIRAAAAGAQAFSDVPKNDVIYDAVVYLKDRGIINGFPDGTYRSDAKVTRAEALKMIVTAKGITPDDVKKYTSTPFTDVPKGTWFLPYVEWGRKDLSIIDGPPKAQEFHPNRTVQKVEFLKMLFLAQGMDAAANADVKLPLSIDVSDVNAWYYPHMRLALSSSTTAPGKNGYLSPDRALTRGDVALLLHRLLLYKEGRRTQDLLSQIETEAITIVSALNAKNIRTAEYASVRALLYARGAKAVVPDEPIVGAALKVTEGFRALVRGYGAQSEKKYDDALKLYQDAWNIGKTAMALSSSAKTYATGIQKSAQQLANDVRALKK